MRFRYRGEISIQQASILGIIYETFASVPAVFQGSKRGKVFPSERMMLYGDSNYCEPN
jgi:hypothetical protein